MFSNYDHSRHQQAIELQTRMQRKVATERLTRRTKSALRSEVAVMSPQNGRRSPRSHTPLSASSLP